MVSNMSKSFNVYQSNHSSVPSEYLLIPSLSDDCVTSQTQRRQEDRLHVSCRPHARAVEESLVVRASLCDRHAHKGHRAHARFSELPAKTWHCQEAGL